MAGVESAEAQVDAFIDKFAPPMQERIRECRAWMSRRFPKAVQLIWDNYNFFVIGISATHRPSDAPLSLACQRTGIALFLLPGATELSDPAGLLRGSGKRVRSLPVERVEDLDTPAVAALIEQALSLASVSMDKAEGPDLVVRSVSAKQRPRR